MDGVVLEAVEDKSWGLDCFNGTGTGPEGDTRCHMDRPHQKCGPLRGPTTGHRQSQREKDEAGRVMRYAPGSSGKQTDTMGANPG